MIITKEQLLQVIPGRQVDIETAHPHLVAAMEKFAINTPLRVAAFIAQVGHESMKFHYTKEIWGPTPEQLRYELPNPKATDLGNIKKGDGIRYKGRGYIQVTGRDNYTRVAKDLGIDCVNQPELLELPKFAALSAGWFWNLKGLNALADQGDFLRITKKINGGTNGLAEREHYYKTALTILK